jgi:5-methyltetrahydropteroyltriglutamate--homocysteine methyltransferase
VAQVRASIERALRDRPADAVFLNPDCGFGTFAERSVNTPDIAFQKLKVIAEAAQTLRREYA